MGERRKLKPLNHRKPERKINHSVMCKNIADATGFRKEDVLEVLYAYGELARQEMLNGNKVYFSGIGTLYPLVQIGKYSPVLQLKKGGDGITKTVYIPKMAFNINLKKDLKEIEISDEIIEAQFAD